MYNKTRALVAFLGISFAALMGIGLAALAGVPLEQAIFVGTTIIKGITLVILLLVGAIWALYAIVSDNHEFQDTHELLVEMTQKVRKPKPDAQW